MFKIMIAVDGSKQSLQAVKQAVLLAQNGLQAQFLVAHVQDPPSILELASESVDLVTNASMEAGMDLVAPAQEVLDAAGVDYEVEISVGEPVTTLLEMAENQQCQQIYIGATGEGALRSILIGSVSREVARRSQLPVTIVKYLEPDPDLDRDFETDADSDLDADVSE